MTEDNKGSSGAPSDNPEGASGDQDGNPSVADTIDPADNEQVSRRAYNKALSEKRTALARLKELEASDATRQQEQLEKDGSLQEKIDFYKTKNEELVTDVSTLKTQLSGEQSKWNEVRKVTAIQDALPFNLPSKYFMLLDTETVLLDPETGSPDPASVQKVVDNFQKEHGAIVASFAPKGKSPSEFPNNSTASDSIGLDEWKKLPYEEKMKQRANIKR